VETGILLAANLNDSERVILGMFRAGEDRESSRTTRDAVTRKCCRTTKRNKKVITGRYLRGKISIKKDFLRKTDIQLTTEKVV